MANGYDKVLHLNLKVYFFRVKIVCILYYDFTKIKMYKLYNLAQPVKAYMHKYMSKKLFLQRKKS